MLEFWDILWIYLYFMGMQTTDYILSVTVLDYFKKFSRLLYCFFLEFIANYTIVFSIEISYAKCFIYRLFKLFREFTRNRLIQRMSRSSQYVVRERSYFPVPSIILMEDNNFLTYLFLVFV